MRNIAVIFLVIVLFISCSEEKKEVKVDNVEAYAFALENGWEINASAIASNFQLLQNEDEYSAKLSYYVNLISPSGELYEEVDYGMADNTEDEEFDDLQIKVQLFVDEGFEPGAYTLQMFVTDDLSETEDSASTKFELIKE